MGYGVLLTVGGGRDGGRKGGREGRNPCTL